MLNEPQIKRMLQKLKQLESTLEPYVFERQDTLSLKKYETSEHLYEVPTDASLYKDVNVGDIWGKERSYCWFKGSYCVPDALAGKPLYAYPHIGSYETMLWVDGVPFGEFAYKIAPTGHGNHYCDMIRLNPKAGEAIELAFEAYAGHYVIGCFPFEKNERSSFSYTYEGIDICTKNQDIADFIFDLKTLNQLAECMDSYSFRRGDVINCLTEVHKVVYYSPEHTDEAVWREALKQAREIMRPCLEAKNTASAAEAGLIGHSHMDTAWLWDIAETIKKCARTYSNQLNLMEQYPEYKFVQSSAYHLEMMRRHYPELFKRMQQAVKANRYEPNGAVWVECDCNITSGEAMVRQFLWGQKYTQKYFDFTSDCFWLPDTFGYSAAIPQIMKGCNVDYFLTTKLSWNDTVPFPYETFNWEGIDGTKVFVHFNTTHNWPEPQTLIGRTEGRGQVNSLQQKTVSNKRLVSYGFGDGGGGPQFEMIEMSRRCKDLDGCPKSHHTTVSEFMRDLEATAVNPNTYAGELYLQLHRGTLTNQHAIKRNNRKAEIAIHNAELLTVANAVKSSAISSDEKIRPMLETLLVNQFHDILPGTCIQTAHEQSTRETDQIIKDATELARSLASGTGSDTITITNTLSFERSDVLHIESDTALVADGIRQQQVESVEGKKLLAIAGLKLPSLGSVALKKGSTTDAGKSVFVLNGKSLTTPFAEIEFNEKGYISSYINRADGRQLVADGGYAFNTLLFAEDVPSEWDNWDVDADFQMKFKDSAELLSEKVVADGEVELRIRRCYKLSELSTVTQDMIFYADSPRIDFETIIDWHDKRRFLKTAFDTTVLSRHAKHEIQFGYVQKPTTRNTTTEQAMFEVVNHKYTDLSETKFGCAILNDCKYGISVEGGNMRLSLHKGGIRPDPRGDEGKHTVTYSFLPHDSAFSAESVIKPAYELNYPPIVTSGSFSLASLAKTNCGNVIIETIKPCEEAEKAFILRLYEAEGTFSSAVLSLGLKPAAVTETNMLEETLCEHTCASEVSLSFKPFEIKTIKISY